MTVVTGTPVDFDRLALVRERLSTDDRRDVLSLALEDIERRQRGFWLE